jgi:hypothetical protein
VYDRCGSPSSRSTISHRPYSSMTCASSTPTAHRTRSSLSHTVHARHTDALQAPAHSAHTPYLHAPGSRTLCTHAILTRSSLSHTVHARHTEDHTLPLHTCILFSLWRHVCAWRALQVPARTARLGTGLSGAMASDVCPAAARTLPTPSHCTLRGHCCTWNAPSHCTLRDHCTRNAPSHCTLRDHCTRNTPSHCIRRSVRHLTHSTASHLHLVLSAPCTRTIGAGIRR